MYIVFYVYVSLFTFQVYIPAPESVHNAATACVKFLKGVRRSDGVGLSVIGTYIYKRSTLVCGYGEGGGGG